MNHLKPKKKKKNHLHKGYLNFNNKNLLLNKDANFKHWKIQLKKRKASGCNIKEMKDWLIETPGGTGDFLIFSCIQFLQMILWNQLRENMLTYADKKEEKVRGTRFQL